MIEDRESPNTSASTEAVFMLPRKKTNGNPCKFQDLFVPLPRINRERTM